VDFWERHYLPYCEKEWQGTGARLNRGWIQTGLQQNPKSHFGTLTLQKYTADMARRFLSSLKTKQGQNTLKPMACEAGKLPKHCKESKPTEQYTMEEAENFITVLVDHVDAQTKWRFSVTVLRNSNVPEAQGVTFIVEIPI
jgi:hypothetical protein